MVNGADAQEGAQSVAALVPNLDSIAQFRIITNNFNAEYGNYSGGQVNVVTKSGTNGFHGDAFEFYVTPTWMQKTIILPLADPIARTYLAGLWAAHFGETTPSFLWTTRAHDKRLAKPRPSSYHPLKTATGNLLDQASALERSDPANGGSGVVGPYWAGLLSSRLGYTVTPGEPYYSAGCTDTTTCVFPNAVIPQNAWDPVSAKDAAIRS